MRLSLGNVLTITATDRWLNELLAGRCFGFGFNLAAGGVGNTGKIQLFNPVGSGITVRVYSFTGFKPTLGQVELRIHNVALGVDQGAGNNLLGGGAASLAHLRTLTDGTAPGLPVKLMQWEANLLKMLTLAWVAQLPAGFGVHLVNTTANEQFVADYFWNEA